MSTEGCPALCGRAGVSGSPGVAGVELGEVVLPGVGEGVLVDLVVEIGLAVGGAGAGLRRVQAFVAEYLLNACFVEDGGHEAHAAAALGAGQDVEAEAVAHEVCPRGVAGLPGVGGADALARGDARALVGHHLGAQTGIGGEEAAVQ